MNLSVFWRLEYCDLVLCGDGDNIVIVTRAAHCIVGLRAHCQPSLWLGQHWTWQADNRCCRAGKTACPHSTITYCYIVPCRTFFTTVPEKYNVPLLHTHVSHFISGHVPSLFLMDDIPDSKVHGANMGPTWVLLAPDGPHDGPMNLAIRDCTFLHPSNTHAALAYVCWQMGPI